jgi:hypothetical protein
MIFGLFGSKRTKENVADLLAEYVMYQQLVGHISKAQSLQKLNRIDEARQVLRNAEQMTASFLNQNPLEKNAHLMMALLYIEAGTPDRAEPIYEGLLNCEQFQLSDDERFIVSGALQKIRRERPLNQRSTDSATGFTQVYCCAHCGRLHNFVSMPCPNCDWSPQTLEEMARSMIMCNAHIKVPALLILAREMAKGRAAEEVMPNLRDDGLTNLSNPTNRLGIERVFSMLRQNEHKNHRSICTVP